MVLVSFSVEIAGTAHIGVILDGTGPGGGWARFFVVGDEGFDALAGQAADFDGTRRDRFGSFIAEFAIKTQHAQAGSKALFGMPSARQDGDNQPFSLRPDGGCPFAEPFRRPLGILAMGTGHMVGVCPVAATAIPTLMDSNAFAAVEYLDHLLRRTDINLLADEIVRHGIEEGLELDMVVGGHAGPDAIRRNS